MKGNQSYNFFAMFPIAFLFLQKLHIEDFYTC